MTSTLRTAAKWGGYFGVAAVGLGGPVVYIHHRRSMVPPGTKYFVVSDDECSGVCSKLYPPSREDMIQKLKTEHFDILVIGGGAAGSGVVFDAATRGLKCGLIEADDFASGTSSKSTKLIHGGVRYLQKAVEELDYQQLALVWEALEERAHLLSAAPFLCNSLGLLMPIYKLWQVPYFWLGAHAYGFLAWIVCCGRPGVPRTSYLSPSASLYAFPTLSPKSLYGSLLYFDGQMNDSRLNLSLALGSSVDGFVEGMEAAAVANHVRCLHFLKNSDGEITGVQALDTETGEEFPIAAQVVVNCAGAHIVLPRWYSSKETFGVLLPQTSDGRVLFLLPWQGQTIAGTTDVAAEMNEKPRATEEDVRFLVEELASYLGADPLQIEKRRGKFWTGSGGAFEFRSDIQSVWCGLRPLVSVPSAAKDSEAKDGEGASSSDIVRSHCVLVDAKTGLVSLLGGKWTTYRRMAQDCVDTILERHSDKLVASIPCRTKCMPVFGAVDPMKLHSSQAARFESGTFFSELRNSYPDVSPDVVKELVRLYGFAARGVLEIAKKEGLSAPLVEGEPFIKAQVVYACRFEQARTVEDVLARRVPLFFINVKKAREAVDEVTRLMAKELKWNAETAKQKKAQAVAFGDLFTAKA